MSDSQIFDRIAIPSVQRMGVDIVGLSVTQMSCGEDALELADMAVRSSAVDIVVIDSVAALVPRAELEGEMGDKLSAHVDLAQSLPCIGQIES